MKRHESPIAPFSPSLRLVALVAVLASPLVGPGLAGAQVGPGVRSGALATRAQFVVDYASIEAAGVSGWTLGGIVDAQVAVGELMVVRGRVPLALLSGGDLADLGGQEAGLGNTQIGIMKPFELSFSTVSAGLDFGLAGSAKAGSFAPVRLGEYQGDRMLVVPGVKMVMGFSELGFMLHADLPTAITEPGGGGSFDPIVRAGAEATLTLKLTDPVVPGVAFDVVQVLEDGGASAVIVSPGLGARLGDRMWLELVIPLVVAGDLADSYSFGGTLSVTGSL